MTKNRRFASNALSNSVILGAALSALSALSGLAYAQSSPPRPIPPPRAYGSKPLPKPSVSAVAAATAAPVKLPSPPAPPNNWTVLNNVPTNVFPTNEFLLTDGRVLAQDVSSGQWYVLSPDNTGSYINGTWSALGSSPQQCYDTHTGVTESWDPLYYASAVLPDGRFVIIGGEYNFDISQTDEVWTNIGQIYDPAANTWTCLGAPSGWNQLGDAMSVVLPNGAFLLGNALGTNVATLNLTTNPPSWTIINPTGTAKSADDGGYNNEEGWTLLPNGNVLTTENWNSLDTTQTPAVQYSSSLQQWLTAGTAPDPLVLVSLGGSQYFEVGPAILRPDGTVFYTGSTGFNDIYNSTANTWAKGPKFPTVSEPACSGTTTEQLAIADGPAALLPDGNVLVEASAVDPTCGYVAGTFFYEFDGTNLNQVAGTLFSTQEVSYTGRLIPLPTGQLLYMDGSGDVEVYTSTGSANSAWAPTITTAPTAVGAGGKNIPISGTQFNGLSGASAYGDDYQAATNYPLVRITNTGTGHVFYAKTHGHSTMGVATGSAAVSTYFDLPANLELGASTLVVVANGIPSASVSLTVLKPGTPALVSSANPSAAGASVTFTATVTGTGGTPTGSVTFIDGTTSLGTSALNGSGVATFSTSSLSIGTHSITALYDGDANFGSTTSAVLSQIVNGKASTAALVSSLNPSLRTQSVTFTVTVTGTGGTPTGTVNFYDGNISLDGNTLLDTATLSGGSAAFSTSTLAPGTHEITVNYSGDANFNSATSTVLTQVVDPTPTTTALSSSLNPSTIGQSVTFTAKLTLGTGGLLSGETITFFDGSNQLGTGTLSSGTATFATSSLTIGTHSITAQYGGDTNYAASTSSVVSQVVNGVASSTALTSSVNPSAVGQSVTFTATVTGTGGTPGGTVTFLDGATTLGTGTLSGGVATFATSTLAAGSHSITAQYGGDSNFAASTSSVLTQVVNSLKASTTALTSSVNPSTVSQSVTFTATVTGTGGTPTGTVTFLDGATTLGTGTLSGGVATFSTSALALGSHSITAHYGGDSSFAASTSSVVTQVVNGKASTTVLTASLNPSTIGQSVTFTATVSGTGGTPTGTVTFLDGVTTLGTGTLSSGVATFATTTLAVGSHSITAKYSGDSNFATSTSSVVTQVVNSLKATTTVLGSSVNPSTIGQPVTFTATVTGTGGTPTGTVTFLDGATTLGTGTLSGGAATFSTSTLALGSHSITAQYGGDSSFAASTSSVVTQVVNPKASTTTLTSSVNPSTAGQSVTFTATVTGTGGTPTGTVTFLDGATTLGTGTLSSGVATFATSTLAVGSHSITAKYSGDSNFATSTSTVVTQVVNTKASTTALTSSVNPSTAGQSVTFTATVTGTGGTPTGTVTFLDGATTLGTGTLTAGVATFSVSSLTVGSHSITASYAGDTNFAASTSSVVTQVVNTKASTTALSSSVNPSTIGLSVTFTATVSGAGGTPTGTVRFLDGVTTLGTVTLSGGVATFSTSTLGAGSHSITAQYGGDSNFASSTSTAVTQVVNTKTSTTALTSSVNPSVAGQSVTFTATVSGAGGTPTGTVTFLDGVTTLGTGTLSSGVATFTTSTLSIASHSITAKYSGDSNFATSTSAVVTQVVNTKPITAGLLSSTNPSVVGQPVTFTATVTGAGGTPTGTVTFLDGATTLGTVGLSSGVAAFTTSALALGSHSITASYSGDANFAPGTSSPVTQVVNNGKATTTALTSSVNPSVGGQSVTFTATVTGAGGTPTGTVTFLDGATTLGTGTLSAGAATFTTAALTIGSHSITASYGGDATFAASTSTVLIQVVTGKPSTTVLTSSLNPSLVGQSVTFTATVTGTAGTPTGTVAFLDGATTLGVGALSGGVATFTTSALAIGSHSITASYGGDTSFAGSISSVVTQVVNGKPSTTVLASSVNPSTAGQSVTFTATVTVTGGTPTGTVTFLDGATTLGSGTLSSGVATFATSTLTAGTHSITAKYAGDANFASSTSSATSQVVLGTSATALTSSINPSQVGQSVTFSATVTGAGGTPTGSVTFLDGTTTLGTGTLTGGVATFTTSTFSGGSHSITAKYSGDSNFAVSTSAVVTQIVNTKASTTALTSSANPSQAGQSVTFTATVTGTGGTPTGTVTFLDGATTLGSGTLSGGVGTFTTSTLAIGSHSVTAQYGGDSNFASSNSSAVTQVVNGKPSTTALASSANPSQGGQSVTFTATVTGTGGTPTGSVTFLDGATTLGTGTLSSGVATFSTSTLITGLHSITAKYAGDSSFAASTSAILSQVVNTKASTTALTSSVNPSQNGQSVTFTATVTGTGGTPTGAVTFLDGATTLGTGTLTAGVATFSISTLTVGSHSITASYAGDTNFAASTSSVVTQVVNTKSSTTAVTSSLNPLIGGQSVTFTATVTGAGGTPTGSVTFLDGAVTLGTGTLSGGVATYSTSSLTTVGSHSITAKYSGDSSFATSTSPSLTQTVSIAGFATPAATTVTAGQTATINITGYEATGSSLAFTLACSGLPSKSTCQFNQNPFTPGNPPNGSVVQLMFGTSSSMLPAHPSNRRPRPWQPLGISVVLLSLMILFTIQRQYAPKYRLAFGSCLAILALATVMTGCTSSGTPNLGNTGTPKGTSTFTVTGTSGSTTISTQVTVTVQ